MSVVVHDQFVSYTSTNGLTKETSPSSRDLLADPGLCTITLLNESINAFETLIFR